MKWRKLLSKISYLFLILYSYLTQLYFLMVLHIVCNEQHRINTKPHTTLVWKKGTHELHGVKTILDLSFRLTQYVFIHHAFHGFLSFRLRFHVVLYTYSGSTISDLRHSALFFLRPYQSREVAAVPVSTIIPSFQIQDIPHSHSRSKRG